MLTIQPGTTSVVCILRPLPRTVPSTSLLAYPGAFPLVKDWHFCVVQPWSCVSEPNEQTGSHLHQG